MLTPEEILHAAPASTLALFDQWPAEPQPGGTPLANRLAALVQTILTANQVMNLTGDADPALFWARHIEDALRAALCLEGALGRPDAACRILDVGSGGGLPGLVWATLWPTARLGLLDARQKRTRFLEQAADDLKLSNVNVLCGRAEELGQAAAWRESFDLVTARALAELPTLLELTLPFARVGGHVAAIKSAPIEGELTSAGRALRELGAEPSPELLPYSRGDGKACVICLARKTAATPPAYPRPANLPERRPLKGRA